MNKITYNPYLDNLKAVLIFLVVLGHFLEIRINQDIIVRTVFSLIYSFHMPLFVFISGYLSKSSYLPEKILKQLLIPYLIFNSIWYLQALIFTPATTFRWFYPAMGFWYLLSLAIWRLLLPVLVKIRFILPLTVIAGIFVGCFNEFGFFLAAARTIAFLPFFMLGYLCTPNQLSAIKIRWSSALTILLLAGVIIYMLPTVFPAFKPGFFYLDNSFSNLKISNFTGIIFRMAFYILTFAVSLAVISIIPLKENRLTIIGRHSLYIFIFHTYAVYLFKNYAGRFEEWFILSAIWLFPVLLTVSLASKPSKKLYELIVTPLTKLLVK